MSGDLRAAVSQLRGRMGAHDSCALTDVQLLENFVERRDAASFEVLVWRHGALVLGLCQRVLRDTHAAEDAFQATFLIFARKAASISRKQAVGSWLYKVAYRVVLRARSRLVQQRAREEPVGDLPAPPAPDEPAWRELRNVLDAEIHRLPEKYRVPFVLCYLEGQTNEEAARQLGCPKGTILSRLARARERLRTRLAGCGLAVSAAALATVLSENSASAMPEILVSSTIRAALPYAAGPAASGQVSPAVVALSEGVLQSMFLTKLKLTAATVLSLATLGPGAGFVVRQAFAERPIIERTDVERPDAEPRQVAAVLPAEAFSLSATPAAFVFAGLADEKVPPVNGRVIGAAPDGKTFTLELPTQARGEPAVTRVIQIGDKTTVLYAGVGPNGAAPTNGYFASVQLEPDSTDLAASVSFQGGAGRGRQADVRGKVVAVKPDGLGVTLEYAVPPPEGVRAAPEMRQAEVVFNDKTQILFSAVGKGQAQPMEGYTAEVWWKEGPQGSTPRTVNFGGTGVVERRERDDGSGISGRILSVSADGGSLSVEQRSGDRTNPTTTTTEVKLNDKTLFFNVGPGEAQPQPGQQVRVTAGNQVAIMGDVKPKQATIAGRVAAVAADGKSITVEYALPRPQNGERPRGEQPLQKSEIKLTDATRVSYHGVGPGEAKLTEGYQAQALLDDDGVTAEVLTLGKPGERRR